MGIKGLAQVIEYLPSGVVNNECDLQNLSGKVVAINAPTCLYQSLISTYFKDLPPDKDSKHLLATFFLNIRLLRRGLKPVYVFDGKLPEHKARKLKSVAHRREKARLEMKKASSARNYKTAAKLRWRAMKIEDHQVQSTKKLLTLMGIPYLQAPGDAEAQCAELVRAEKVYATASGDLDSLVFGSKVLFHNLTSRSKPTEEIHLDKVLKGIGIDLREFVDLSILLGCDFCGEIKNVGPLKAVMLIRKYKNIENILQNIDPEVYKVPQDWRYNEARYWFEQPLVTKSDKIEFQWKPPDIKSIRKYLCQESRLNNVMVLKGLDKLSKPIKL